MKRTISLLAIVAVAVSLTAGTAALSMSAAGAKSSDLPTVSIAMDGSSITVDGTLQSGAVTVESTVTNEASASPVLVRLDQGVTADDFLAAVGAGQVQDPNDVSPYGAIVFSAEAPQGTSDIDTMLEAADYVALDAAKGAPMKWPTAEFTVTEAAQPAELPAADATVHAIDFGFTGPKTLNVGDVVRWQNDGIVAHMIVAFRVRNIDDAKKVVKLLRAGKDGKAGRYATGFASFMDPASTGAVQQQTLSVKRGVYVLACFMDTQDGREHTQIGMERIITIAK
jgi:plastocyanin